MANPMALEINCINKDERKNPYERITHIGGGESLMSRWRKPLDEAIADIENGRANYRVGKGLMAVDVVVATSQFGNKYLRTTSDKEEPNNLLNLPECQP